MRNRNKLNRIEFMEEKSDKEAKVDGKENLRSRLENFARSPELQEIFASGIASHIKALKEENQPTEDENPDITEALDELTDLEEKVKLGFGGLVLRHVRSDGSQQAYFSLTSKDDLLKESPSYFDFNEETEKWEYGISIIQRTPLSAFGRSPEEVVESGGFQVEIFRQRVRSHGDTGGIEFKRESGFSVRVAEGNCIGKGMVSHGRTGYKSERTYEMGDLNIQAQSLETQIKELNIF